MKSGAGKRNAGDLGRREFLTVTGAGIAALAFPTLCPAPATKLGAIGLQLYTVRDLMKNDVAGTLASVARIGYREVEFAGYFDHTPEQIRGLLTQNGLTSPATHVGFDAVEQDWDATLHTASRVGHHYVVCAWVPEERRRTLADWRGIAETFNRAGAAAQAAGLQFAYHNHNFEFVPLEGQVPYDVLTSATDPKLVQLEVDLFWITFAGADPLDYFKRYPGRFPLVHVKDMKKKPSPDVSAEQVMTSVGNGSIDWRGIFAHAPEAGIEHYFVEHDSPADPLASIRTSFEYLHRLDV